MNDRLVITTVILALAGCGGAAAEPETPDEAAAEPEIGPPPEPWEQMSFDERKRYMGRQVMPVVAPMFEAYDPEAFAGFSCDTCHGEDMQDRGFEMPNPSLPALYPTGTPEQRQMVEEHPELVRFMFNDVLPTMQTLLGAEPYDEDTGTGFSCFSCHPHAEGAGASVDEPPDAG